MYSENVSMLGDYKYILGFVCDSVALYEVYT